MARFRSRRLCGAKRMQTRKGYRGKVVSTAPLPGAEQYSLQIEAGCCKIILLLTGGEYMHDWNSDGQIDLVDQFIDYMIFTEVMGSRSDDDSSSEEDED